MKLYKLLDEIKVSNIINDQDVVIRNISDHSKNVKKGTLFVAIKGNIKDGHDYLDEVIKKNPAAIVINENSFNQLDNISFKGPILIVKDTRKFLLKSAINFYGVSRKYLDAKNNFLIFSVTGTNGKTTTCYFIEEILKNLGKNPGKFTTINNNFGLKTKKSFLNIDASITTPGVISLQSGIRKMLDSYCDAGVIETSSHGLDQYRIDPLQVSVAVLTNISHDHLDYHKTLRNYVLAKRRLFQELTDNSYAVLNIDDNSFLEFKNITKAKVVTYGLNHKADFKAFDICKNIEGSKFKISYPNGILKIKTNFLGLHNVYNILAAISAVFCFNPDIENVLSLDIFNKHNIVPGRLQEVYTKKDYKVFIDYAHTPDALLNILKSLRELTKGKLLLVFGCGGNRDKKKRPVMGEIASANSDYFIITNDNPRNEVPDKIVVDIKKGIPGNFKNYEIILERAEAIKKVLNVAGKNDVVVIAGKGHEKYQLIKDRKIFFDDYLTVKNLLENNLN